MSSATIMYHLSSQWKIINSLFQGTLLMCLWFHLSILMTKMNVFPKLPFFATNSLGKYGHPLSYSHTPSKFCRHSLLCYTVPRVTPPLARFPHIKRSKNSGISLPQNHHTSHSMLMEINGHYWVPVSHNGPSPKLLYQHILACSNSLHYSC